MIKTTSIRIRYVFFVLIAEMNRFLILFLIIKINKANQNTIDLLKKVLSVMQMFAITQLGCGSKTFEKNTLKKASNHWGLV